MDFDETRLYYSHQALQNSGTNNDDAVVPDDDDDHENFDPKAVRRHFREFLRTFVLLVLLACLYLQYLSHTSYIL